MDFMDEEIIQMRNKNRKISLEEGVLIKGEFIEFEPVKLFDDKLEIMLPKTFVDMPSDLAKIKYPSESRPQIIKTDSTGGINFCFNLFEQSVKEDELKDIAKTFSKMIKKVNPANVFYDQKTEEIVVNYSIRTFGDSRVLKLKCLSNTYLMDIDKKIRVFQNKASLYKDVLSYLNTYGNYGFIMTQMKC